MFIMKEYNFRIQVFYEFNVELKKYCIKLRYLNGTQ